MAAREERKVVTVLFADLVGSTGLGERLHPEEVKLVVGEAMSRIVREVEELGGYVKDLAGDGVLSFFGAPVTHEDDAERAVRAGLRIAETIASYGREVAQAWGFDGVAVRVGICTGPVVLGHIGAGGRTEYAAFGDTVNTAARLQAAAGPGSVLVDAATRRLVEPLFEWRASRQLELRGKSDAVAAHEAGPPRRGPAARQHDAALVGRERELSAAAELVDRVRDGGGGVLVLTGEPGIGKSRLLAELRDRFAGLWLEGRCVSYGEGLSLWPFRELLRDWLGLHLDEPELRVRVSLRRALDRLFGDRGTELYPYLAFGLDLDVEPDARELLTALSPEARQYRTFEVVSELVARLAHDEPLVIAVEDLHWADATSLVLLERLLPVAERAAVLFAVTQRQERDHGSWAFIERASREFPHLLRHLDLEPLGESAEADLLRTLVGGDGLPRELERRLIETASGNPFFLEELVRSLADAGALVGEAGRRQFDHDVSIEVPQTIEKVILARIDQLSRPSHDVLLAASALGRRFGLPLLEGVYGAGVETALHDLQRADLVRVARRWPEPEYRFKHVLIQETAYGTLLAERRQELHRKAAEWLERRYSESDEAAGLLARHWLAAADEEKAIRYLVRAGDKARSEWALDEAIEHYRELLPLLERRGERQEMALVLLKLGLALHTALRFREANEAYRRAFDLWEQPVPAEATATLRAASDAVVRELDPPLSYRPPDMQLQMALFDRLVERLPEATIAPSLAERWEVSDDGLRYVFHLRPRLTWSDGAPLTAHDVEYGVKRSLDPDRPGVSVAIYYVLEHGQDFALARTTDESQIGVRALDDRTLEFRLVAPAPYFLSVVNRPDAGPRPRHAIETHGDGWLDPGVHVVGGAFRLAERSAKRLVLARRPDAPPRAGNVARVEVVETPLDDALRRYEAGEFDIVTAHPTSQLADLIPVDHPDAQLGPPAWTFYLLFDHRDPTLASLDLRRALAHSIDREALRAALPPNFLVAGGGLVPPALQGHTPDIAPRFDPERAREHIRRAGVANQVQLATTIDDPVGRMLELVVAGWREVLGIDVEIRVPDEDFATARMRLLEEAPFAPSAWFPGYPDPEYYLRLLLHSEAADNRGHWRHPPFDDVIERARRETDGRRRLELFHEAERIAIAEQVAVIPIAYARNVFFVKPWVSGWWEFGKSWSSFADLVVDEEAQPQR